MKKRIHKFQKIFILLVTTTLLFSCSNDKDQMAEENFDSTALNAEDVQTVLETDSSIGIADNLLSSLFVENSTTGKNDNNNDCYTSENSDTGYVLTFTNCTLNGIDNVRGTIEVVYAMQNEMSAFTTTYSDFYINDIKIDGTRSFLFDGETNGSLLTFSVTSDMTLVLVDETIITENGTRLFGFSTGNTLEDIAVTLNGNWTLIVGSDTYTVNIIDTLKTKIACTYISEGEMSLDKNGLTVGIDFGDGICDDSATIIYPNGVIEEVSLED